MEDTDNSSPVATTLAVLGQILFVIALIAIAVLLIREQREKAYWADSRNYTPTECYFHEEFVKDGQTFGTLGALTYMTRDGCRSSCGFHSWKKTSTGWIGEVGARVVHMDSKGRPLKKTTQR